MKYLAPLLILAACAAPEREAAAPVREPPPQRAAAPPATEPPRPQRMTWTVPHPVMIAPVQTPNAAFETAPLPNRDIELRPAEVANPLNPTLEPMLLPPERRFGATFGREHLRETGPDRPFDNILPGARLIIPLEPTAPSR
jgi:hypothetical protein